MIGMIGFGYCERAVCIYEPCPRFGQACSAYTPWNLVSMSEHFTGVLGTYYTFADWKDTPGQF